MLCGPHGIFGCSTSNEYWGKTNHNTTLLLVWYPVLTIRWTNFTAFIPHLANSTRTQPPAFVARQASLYYDYALHMTMLYYFKRLLPFFHSNQV